MRRVIITLGVLALVTLAATACGSSTRQDVAVSINYEADGVGGVYSPAVIHVAPGTQVTWVEHDTHRLHTVTADDNSFGSKFLSPNQTYTVRFNKPGTYAYHCEVHPGMVGEIVVG